MLDVNRNIFNKPVGNGILDPDEIAALANATFQFRFWRTQCNGTVNNAFIEFTGAVLRSSFKNTDVVLLELINPPGIGDLVNYAGWDRQTAKPSDVNSFIIHHPQGEDMRITNTSNVKTWLSNNGFWTAHYSSGTVDKGSSGSALMNASGQIVGQLKGGWSNCNYTNFGDRYGKFDRSWSPAGLQTWLSPAQALQSTAILNLTDITIDGPTTVGCTTPGIFSTLPNLLDVTYQWTVTAGMQINSGQGTSTVNISRIPGSTVTTGTLTLILRSPNKGWTRIYTVANQITFGTPPLSISSSTNGCSGSYQIWNLINNTPNNGSNWLWTVSYLSTPSSQINIYSPSSPSTMLSVTGGGTVTLSYTDQCGVAQTTGVTVYNSGCFGYRVAVSPNPAKNNMSVSLAPLSSNQEITNATTATVNTTPIKVIPSNGKTIMSLFEINTNLLVKRWTYNEVTNQNYNFNINGLRKGVYVLQIDRNNTATTTKVIIQ